MPSRDAPHANRANVDLLARSHLPQHPRRHNCRKPRHSRRTQRSLQKPSPGNTTLTLRRHESSSLLPLQLHLCSLHLRPHHQLSSQQSLRLVLRRMRPVHTSETNCGPNGSVRLLQSINRASFLSTINRLLPSFDRATSTYLRSSMYPSVPRMNKRPSPQVPSPSGVNQSSRTYPNPRSPRSIMSPKSWNRGFAL